MQPDISELALGLYESMLDGASLLPALSAVAGRIGASAFAVHKVRYRDGRPVGSVSTGEGGVAGAGLEEYGRYWVRHDPWAQKGMRLPAGVHDISTVVPPEALRRSRIWNEWGRPNDAAFHALGVPLVEEGSSIGGVFFHRREREQPFGRAERAVLDALFPHLRRVFAAGSRLAMPEEAPQYALRAGLDALPDGIALVDEARRLAFANAALRRMAAQEDGLRLGTEGLDVPDPGTRLALARALTAALAAAAGQLGLLPSAGSLALPRPSGRTPWMVRALPVLRIETAEVPTGFRGAMLLVTDGERRSAPAPALLARLFGLTPAEASLAGALAAGHSAEQHAKRRGVSRETVRTQLAAIRRKTGCRRQAELAALLARLPG